MPIEKVNWDKYDVVSCDDRGRATLGKEFANKQLFVWIAEADVDNYEKVINTDEKDELDKMVAWAEENVDDYVRLRPSLGIVMDKEGNKYYSPFGLNKKDDESKN